MEEADWRSTGISCYRSILSIWKVLFWFCSEIYLRKPDQVFLHQITQMCWSCSIYIQIRKGRELDWWAVVSLLNGTPMKRSQKYMKPYMATLWFLTGRLLSWPFAVASLALLKLHLEGWYFKFSFNTSITLTPWLVSFPRHAAWDSRMCTLFGLVNILSHTVQELLDKSVDTALTSIGRSIDYIVEAMCCCYWYEKKYMHFQE